MTVHRTHPPTRAMRDNPDIDQLKRQARELLEASASEAREGKDMTIKRMDNVLIVVDDHPSINGLDGPSYY